MRKEFEFESEYTDLKIELSDIRPQISSEAPFSSFKKHQY